MIGPNVRVREDEDIARSSLESVGHCIGLAPFIGIAPALNDF